MCNQMYRGYKCEIGGIRGVCSYAQILRSSTLRRVAIIFAETLHVMQHTTPCRVQDNFNMNEKKEVGETVQLWWSSVSAQPVRLHVLANYASRIRQHNTAHYNSNCLHKHII
jgi:hypothetical protein